jgi:hypothetical protein
MPGVVSSLLCIVVEGLALALLIVSIARKCFRRFFFVNLYAAVVLLSDGARYFALKQFGYSSPEYFYSFYITDAALVTSTYLIILSFYEVIFGKTSLRREVRLALTFFVILVAGISYVMISGMTPAGNPLRFYSHLLVEFVQNMYFAAVILTVLVWISVLYLRVEDTQLRMLIAGLGISLSVQAAYYAFQNLLPQDLFQRLQQAGVLRYVSQFAAIAKFGLWCVAVSGLPVFARERESQRVLQAAEVKGSA